MNLVVLIGSGAVGKMTVGQELMKITDYRLFHNHHMIEPVIEIFGKYDGAMISKLREDIFDAFLKTDYSGLIFTYMWAFDMQSDWDYIKSVTDKFEANGGNVYDGPRGRGWRTQKRKWTRNPVPMDHHCLE